MVHCNISEVSLPESNIWDVRTQWQCPPGAQGRYVYLYFKEASFERALCEIKVFAEEIIPASSMQTGECMVINSFI